MTLLIPELSTRGWLMSTVRKVVTKPVDGTSVYTCDYSSATESLCLANAVAVHIYGGNAIRWKGSGPWS